MGKDQPKPLPGERSQLIGQPPRTTLGVIFELLRIIAPALLGNMLEFYEFGVYVLVTPQITDNFFAAYGDFGTAFGVWFGFSISFVVRPVGAALFGYIGDTFGRKLAINISVVGMIVCTAGIGALPTASCCGSAVGFLGVALLLCFKLCQGLFVGGELAATITFAVENAGKEHVATAMSLATATATGGLITSELVVLVVESLTTDAQMTAWGWRLPFLLALPWGLIAVRMMRGLEESAGFAEHLAESSVDDAPQASPLAIIRRGYKLPLLLGVTAVGAHAAFFWGSLMFPKDFLVTSGVRVERDALCSTLLGLTCNMTAMLFAGVACDRIGPLRFALGWAAAVLVASWPLWCLLVVPGRAWASYVALFLMGTLSGSGICVSVVSLELFPMAVRATGFGLVYNLAQAIFSSLAPFVAKAATHTFSLNASGDGAWLANSAPALWPTVSAAIGLTGLLTLRRAAIIGKLTPTHIRHSPYM